MTRVAIIVGLFLCALSPAEVYIKVSGAAVRRAKIAVGQVHPIAQPGSSHDRDLAEKIQEQARLDLDFTGLFESINSSQFSQFDKPNEVRSIRYEDWSSLQASFVLKMGYWVLPDGKLVLEAIFYDVPGGKKIFGTRYQYPSNNYPRLVHTLVEDIMKAVTGEKGLFSSRILMSCRDTRRRSSPPKEIYVIDTDGRNLKRLTSDETLSLSPSWSPDGKIITYTQFEFRRVGGIKKKLPVLKRHDLRTGKRLVISAKEGMNSGAAWSPDGSRIAATLSFTGRPEIYFLNPNGNSEPVPMSRNVQWRKTAGEGLQASSTKLLFDVEPSWSPDGKRLVISSARTGHPMIYVVELATNLATQLTFAGTYNASPAWSPRGDKILFAAQRLAEGNFDLHMIDPDGNNLARLTSGDRPGRKVNSENPSWGPTGRHVAFASNETGNYAIYVMTIDGLVRRRISPPNLECSTPSWGPAEG